MEVGDSIRCIEEFSMTGGNLEGRKVFTLGKLYEIFEADHSIEVVSVLNDLGGLHRFAYEGEFFKQHFLLVAERYHPPKTISKKA